LSQMTEKFKVRTFAELLQNFCIIYDRPSIEKFDKALSDGLNPIQRSHFFDYVERIVEEATLESSVLHEAKVEKLEDRIKELEHKLETATNVLFD